MQTKTHAYSTLNVLVNKHHNAKMLHCIVSDHTPLHQCRNTAAHSDIVARYLMSESILLMQVREKNEVPVNYFVGKYSKVYLNLMYST